jgi:hypothetical protein
MLDWNHVLRYILPEPSGRMSTAEQVMESVKMPPEDLQSEAADFARLLKESRIGMKRTKFRRDWAGAGRPPR